MTQHRISPRTFVAMLLAIAAVPSSLSAHGGNRVVEVVSGPYVISASVSRAGDQIDETVGVIDAAKKTVIEDAVVAVSLERDGERRGPFPAYPRGGGYEARYPPPDGEGWTVLIDVQGPAGAVVVRHPYRAPGANGIGGGAGLLLNLGLLALLAAAALLLPRWGRFRRSPARSGAGTTTEPGVVPPERSMEAPDR